MWLTGGLRIKSEECEGIADLQGLCFQPHLVSCRESAKMDGVDKNEYIANFVQITGANEEKATMCLTATEWNLAVSN